MKLAYLTLVLGLLTAGCSTNLAKKLDQVEPGMDKAHVLDIAGNPKRTFRQHSQDVWIYNYYINSRHLERDVRFTDGHVTAISETREIRPPDQATEDRITEDYEKLAEEADRARATKTKEKEKPKTEL